MKDILEFLRSLAANNNREWFNENKPAYQHALEAFKGFTAGLIEGISTFDPGLSELQAKDSIFRIYKDVRFSKDKSPYKTHFGAWMTRGGRKSTDAGYYFHLEPGATFMAAGVWMPPKEQLQLIRQEMVYQPEKYLEIIHAPHIRSRFERGGTEDRLKKGPAGYPKDHPMIEELKYKHVVFSRNYSDKEVLKKGFSDELTGDFKGLSPLVSYLNHAMSFTGNE